MLNAILKLHELQTLMSYFMIGNVKGHRIFVSPEVTIHPITVTQTAPIFALQLCQASTLH